MAKVSLMEIVLSSFVHCSSLIEKFTALQPCRGVAQATAKQCCAAKGGYEKVVKRRSTVTAAQMGLCTHDESLPCWEAISGFVL